MQSILCVSLKNSIIPAGTTCIFYTHSVVLSSPELPCVESTQHVLCNTCSLARSQWYLNLNLYPLSHPRPRPHPRPHPQTAQPQTTQLYIKGIANLFVKGLTTLLQEILRFNVNSRSCPKKWGHILVCFGIFIFHSPSSHMEVHHQMS